METFVDQNVVIFRLQFVYYDVFSSIFASFAHQMYDPIRLGDDAPVASGFRCCFVRGFEIEKRIRGMHDGCNFYHPVRLDPFTSMANKFTTSYARFPIDMYEMFAM